MLVLLSTNSVKINCSFILYLLSKVAYTIRDVLGDNAVVVTLSIVGLII